MASLIRLISCFGVNSWLVPDGAAAPFFKHSIRPVQDGIFNGNSDHANLPPLLAKRIPKRPMRGSPRVEFVCVWWPGSA